MEVDPEYRILSKRHGYTLGLYNAEMLTREQAQEEKHQVRMALAEIERKEKQHQRVARKEQLDKTMGTILLEQMDVLRCAVSFA